LYGQGTPPPGAAAGPRGGAAVAGGDLPGPRGGGPRGRGRDLLGRRDRRGGRRGSPGGVRPRRGPRGHGGGGAGPPDATDVGGAQRGGGPLHDLQGDDGWGAVHGVPGPVAPDLDTEDLPDRGPPEGPREGDGAGLGGSPKGPDRVVPHAPVYSGVQPGRVSE